MARGIQATLIVVAILVLGFAAALYLITAPYRELNAWGHVVISRLEVAKSKPPLGVDVDRCNVDILDQPIRKLYLEFIERWFVNNVVRCEEHVWKSILCPSKNTRPSIYIHA